MARIAPDPSAAAYSPTASLVHDWTLPHPALRAHVDRYWTSVGAAGTLLPTLLPGTGVELFFHLGQPFVTLGAAGTRLAPRAHLGYLRSRPMRLRADAGFEVVAVRIRSGALRHLCPALPAGGADDPLAAAELWGHELDIVADRLCEAGTLAARARVLDAWLLGCLEAHAASEGWIDRAVDDLYYRHADARIDALAADCGFSRRHFERRFKLAIGCSPKAFQRVARFQHTMRELTLGGGARYLDAALAHGFYDQAHFIREFESFVGEQPGHFLADQRGRSHFYNASLPRRR
jgi:AraC-like DNA-binding protein